MLYKYLITYLSGIIGVLSFSPFKIKTFGIISFCLLQILIINKSNIKSFFTGFSWGMGFFSGGVHWIYISISDFTKLPLILKLLLTIFFISYLSIYPGVFSYFINKFFTKLNASRFIFASPGIWHITEYIRGSLFTGFPWLQFGYTQIHGPLNIIGPIFGVQMITFFFIIITGFLIHGGIQKKKYYFILILIILIFFNLFKNHNWTKPIFKKKTIVLIQGNIPQNLKWNKKYTQYNILSYFNLSKPYIGKVDLIVWPESAIPNSEKENKKLLKLLNNILIHKNTHLITGIIKTKKKKDGSHMLFNSITTFGIKKNNYFYKKHHLVPFGEFIPYKNFFKFFFPFLKFTILDFTPGKYKQKQIKIKNINLSVNICYEIIFGDLIRNNIKQNTNFLLTISDDSWFKKSIEPWQHFEMAQMRSLETGLPLLYVSNTGITAFIKHNGKIKKIIPQFISSALKSTIKPRYGLTPYITIGNYPVWISTLIFIIIAYLKKNK